MSIYSAPFIYLPHFIFHISFFFVRLFSLYSHSRCNSFTEDVQCVNLIAKTASVVLWKRYRHAETPILKSKNPKNHPLLRNTGFLSTLLIITLIFWSHTEIRYPDALCSQLTCSLSYLTPTIFVCVEHWVGAFLCPILRRPLPNFHPFDEYASLFARRVYHRVYTSSSIVRYLNGLL